jgi:hypothetical protein
MQQLLREAKQDASISGIFWRDPHDIMEQKRAIMAYLRRRNMRTHTNQNRLGFLYYAYNEDRWWYEIIELFRKFLLNGVVVTIQTGQTSKIMFGVCLCLLFLVMVQNIHPHKAESDHVLMVVSHVQLFVTMFAGLILTEKIEFLSSFESNRRLARVQEVKFIEIFVITTHLGTLMYGISCVFYEKYFSPEVMRMLKIEAHHNAVMKRLKASAKKGWKNVSIKAKMIKGKKLLNGKKQEEDQILDLLMDQELEDLSTGEAANVKVVSLKSTQLKIMNRLRAQKGTASAFGVKQSGIAGLLGQKGKSTKVLPQDQIAKLKNADQTIAKLTAEQKSTVDFNWEEDDTNTKEDEIRQQITVQSSGGSSEGGSGVVIETQQDLEDMQNESKKRDEKIRSAFRFRLKNASKRALNSRGIFDQYESDKKSITVAKGNLKKALEGKSLKVLKTEVDKIKANPAVWKAMKKEVTAAEEKCLSESSKLIDRLKSAMNDHENPKQLPILEKILDEVTSVGVTDNDELIAEAMEKMISLEHFQKLRALVEGMSNKVIADLKSYSKPDKSIETIMRCVFIFLGHEKSHLESWKDLQVLIGKT